MPRALKVISGIFLLLALLVLATNLNSYLKWKSDRKQMISPMFSLTQLKVAIEAKNANLAQNIFKQSFFQSRDGGAGLKPMITAIEGLTLSPFTSFEVVYADAEPQAPNEAPNTYCAVVFYRSDERSLHSPLSVKIKWQIQIDRHQVTEIAIGPEHVSPDCQTGIAKILGAR